MEGHGVEANTNAVAFCVAGEWGAGREEGELPFGLGVFIEDADGVPPGFALGIVDFAQIENLPLDDAAGGSFILDDAVVAMGFAVFETPVGFEEHSAVKNTPISRNAIPGVCTRGRKRENGGFHRGNPVPLTLK